MKRQARILEQLAKEELSDRPSVAGVEAVVSQAIDVVFCCQDQNARAMERPNVLQEDDSVTVVDPIASFNSRQKQEAEHSNSGETAIVLGCGPVRASRMDIGALRTNQEGSIYGSTNDETATAARVAGRDYLEASKVAKTDMFGPETQLDPEVLGSSKTDDIDGMRKKRTVHQVRLNGSGCPDLAVSTYQSDKQVQVQHVHTTRGDCATVKAEEGRGAQEQHVPCLGGVSKIASLPSFCKIIPDTRPCAVVTNLRSGVRVRNDDAFLQWSRHIQKCDEIEQSEVLEGGKAV